MYYFIAALILFAFFGLFYKIILPANEPNFELMGIQSDENLRLSVMNIAAESKVFSERGKGLSTKLISIKVRRAFRTIKAKIDNNEKCYDFEHWIYDNYYKINDAILKQRKLQLSYLRLPHVKDLPRIYSFLQFVVKATGGGCSKALLKELVSAYCDVTPLTFSEISIAKSVLEYCLIEYIAIFCSKVIVIANKEARAKKDAKKGRVNLAEINFNSYIQGMDIYCDHKLRRGVEDVCLSNGLNMRQRIDNFFRQLSSYAGSVQASITNLHGLDTLDDEYIINLSPLNKLFEKEPNLNYAGCTLATRYVYLYSIDRIARKKRQNELAYARAIIDKSKNQKTDIAAYILPKTRSKTHMRIYICVVLLTTILLAVLVACFVFDDIWALVFALIPILFGFSLLFWHEFLGVVVKRRYLPRMQLSKEKYENCKTMILFTRLIADKAEIDDTFRHLETIRYANFEDVFSYGVLIDLPAADTEEFSQKERELLSQIELSYSQLKERNKYNVFIRKRRAVSGEKKYQGWEKKRGALLDLNELIINKCSDKFDAVYGSRYTVKYIIALDSDTLLNCGRELVEIMEHPYNSDKNVISLSMGTNPSSANKTAFSRLMSGSVGLGNYSDIGNDINFDVYGHGNYTGKGIYRVKEFHGRVSDKFMDNRILSHDFIEGAMAGCSNTSEKALDSFPSNFSSFIGRQQRWIRGDWQLLPYLFAKIRNRNGIRVVNPLAPIDKWHIFCNLISSMIPISSLVVIMLSLFWVNSLQVLFFALMLNIVHILNGLRISTLKNPKIAAIEFLRQLYSISCLPVVAVYSLYSIIVTLIRLLKKKKLLEWKVFAHSKGGISFLSNILIGIYLIMMTIFLAKNAIYFILAAIFLSAPIVNRIISVQKINGKRQTLEAHHEMLLGIARRTWYFFEEQFKNGFTLPCDNYQQYLGAGYARRTSPTNIGMALVSICSALELGFVDGEKANHYIETIITSLEKAEKWHGNLYNWIDIDTLTSLVPKYVSSVDSGNLLAGLLLVLQYVTHNKTRQRIELLIDETRIEKLYDENRGLFYIGYNETDKSFDKNHYDLMASESVLTYLIAIGTGKISKISWNNLSRQHVRFFGKMLYSWTGGAFEYLMPSIFFEYPKGSMMEVSAKNAVKANVKYAERLCNKFWGISESQYNSVDNNGLYQYRAFGVPEIALSNFPPKKVFSPYASCLALSVTPKAACKNIYRMTNADMLDEFGFFEARDDGEIIKSYMSHHQGMILASLANFLSNGAIIKKMRENPSVRAAELLMTQPNNRGRARRKIRTQASPKKTPKSDFVVDRHYTLPKINLLSGGKYNLLIDQYGKGYSVYDDIYLSRCDRYCGMEILLTISKSHFGVDNSKGGDRGDEQISMSEKISLIDGLNTAHSFCSTKFSKITKDISASINVFVLPNISGEVRDICIKNIGNSKLDISISSFMEISLATKEDYIAHRAYSNMFLFSKYEADGDFLLVTRRNKNYPFVAHYFNLGGILYSANRAKKFQRCKDCEDFGHMLDTVLSGTMSAYLTPAEELKVQIYTVVSYDLEYLKRQIKMTRSDGYLKRVSAECFSISKRLNPSLAVKDIASKLLFAPKGVSAALIKIGINTDIPLILFELESINSLQRLRVQIETLKKLYKFDISFNLVILYSEKNGYFTCIGEAINSIIEQTAIYSLKTAKSTLVKINKNEASKELLFDLENFATDIINIINEEIIYDFESSAPKYACAELPVIMPDLKMGIGGFLKDGSYFMNLTDVDTPSPWSNIIANEEFGTLITESGGGYTYFKNARENKLTSWSNDNLEDFPSESVIFQEGNVVWSATKKPLKTDSEYIVIHSFGYSEFINNFNGTIVHEKQYINGNTKFFDVLLKNRTSDERKISIAAIFEGVIGTHLMKTSAHLDFSVKENTIIATNSLNGQQIYVQSNYKLNEYAFYRESCSGSDGNINRAKDFGKNGHKKCIAYSANLIVKPNSSARIIFSLGVEKDVDFQFCDSYLNKAVNYYSQLSVLSIKTGSAELDYILKWLPYQMLTSRFFARTGFYQAGGAKGFRDQLQDCLAILYINPSLVHEHILCAASHQFEDGDVQHWWHEPAVGVRTRISDDKLFLPLATAEYIEFTGNYEILSKRVPYLKNIHLPHGQSAVYSSAEFTEYSGSILEHCIKAIKSAFRFGENGLMLMGGGDWNDAMDLVGINGKGTTVWCSMFLYYVIGKFLPYVTNLEDRQEFLSVRSKLLEATDAAWDGEWFLRAFTDDGREVGGKNCKECKIDLITQSWAKISEITSDEKSELALYAASSKLIDAKNGIIRLLWPPFSQTKGIGYISQYPPGVRENGGQYTHGAVWFIISLFKSGKTRLAYDLLKMINPINHGKNYDDIMRYSVEPYVVAADVYGGEHSGRGGWSWYTGAAAWLYKCIVENLLGIKISNKLITVEPNLPEEIKNISVEYRTNFGKIRLDIDNSGEGNSWYAQIGKIKYGTSTVVVCDSIIGKTINFKKKEAKN